jgi:hypothetical protein
MASTYCFEYVKPGAARRLPAEEAEQIRPDPIRLALAEGIADAKLRRHRTGCGLP